MSEQKLAIYIYRQGAPFTSAIISRTSRLSGSPDDMETDSEGEKNISVFSGMKNPLLRTAGPENTNCHLSGHVTASRRTIPIYLASSIPNHPLPGNKYKTVSMQDIMQHIRQTKWQTLYPFPFSAHFDMLLPPPPNQRCHRGRYY